MSDFAKVDDIINLKRELTAQEQERAGYLIPVVSNLVREQGKASNKDIDAMVSESASYADVVKSVVVGVVLRELDTPAGQLPVTQQTESTGGVSLTYSLPNASDTIRLWPSDIKLLGLRKQRIGVIEFWEGEDE